jgi:hypothetical protein
MFLKVKGNKSRFVPIEKARIPSHILVKQRVKYA